MSSKANGVVVRGGSAASKNENKKKVTIRLCFVHLLLHV